MVFFRHILISTSLVLLLAFTGALAEEALCCIDEAETATAAPCQEDCCVQCMTFHHMNLPSQSVFLISQIPDSVLFKNYEKFLQPFSFTALIYRPPISFLS